MPSALHIFLSDITPSQSRLYKEAAYVLSNGILDKVAVLGLWSKGSLERETDASGIDIYRKSTLLRRYRHIAIVKRFSVLRKILFILSLIQYFAAAVTLAHRLQPSHVCCHNADMLPVAWVAARLSGATLEYLPHELETQRSGLSGMAKRITTFIESHFIRFARNVVVVCEPIQKWYQDAYELTNVHVVRNVPERDAVQIRPIPEGGFREHFAIPDSAKVFIYQGLFSPGRGIEELLEAFAALDPVRCHLVLMGYGEGHYQALINVAVKRHVNIHYQPAVAREWIVSYSASADVGIFISERATLSYRFALPNKFYEWAHAGLPILVSDNLEYQADLLRQGEFGWTTSLADLTESVRRVAEIDLAPFALNARRYAAMAMWEEDAKTFSKVYRIA